MNKLRHINLGLIEPKLIQAIWEYPEIVPLKVPTIFTYSPNKDVVGTRGIEELSKKIKTENLPKDIGFYRYKGREEAAYVICSGTLLFVLHYPDTNLFEQIDKGIKAIMYKTLRACNIPVELNHKNNDLYFLKDGMQKKFFGIMDDSLIEGWKTKIFSVGIKFNSDLANKLYRLDTNKFTKKGDIKDISEVVGGLSEVVQDIDRDEVVGKVIQDIADRFNLSIEKDNLTEEESSKMNGLVNKLDNKEWKLHGKRD